MSTSNPEAASPREYVIGEIHRQQIHPMVRIMLVRLRAGDPYPEAHEKVPMLRRSLGEAVAKFVHGFPPENPELFFLELQKTLWALWHDTIREEAADMQMDVSTPAIKDSFLQAYLRMMAQIMAELTQQLSQAKDHVQRLKGQTQMAASAIIPPSGDDRQEA